MHGASQARSMDKQSGRLAAVENVHDVPDDEPPPPARVDRPTAHR